MNRIDELAQIVCEREPTPDEAAELAELLADPGKPMPFVPVGQKKAEKRRPAGARK